MDRFLRLLALSAAAFVAACAAQEPTTGTIITGVTVVDSGALSPDMALVVDAGRITRVARASSITAAATAMIIDASSKYVVPGYLDMHAHVVDFADESIKPWPLLIANGITGFRQMTGNPALLERGRQATRGGVG